MIFSEAGLSRDMVCFFIWCFSVISSIISLEEQRGISAGCQPQMNTKGPMFLPHRSTKSNVIRLKPVALLRGHGDLQQVLCTS